MGLAHHIVQLKRTLINTYTLNNIKRIAMFKLKRKIKVNLNRRSKIKLAKTVLLAILY